MAILPNGSDLAELQHSLPQGVRCEITEDCLRLWWRNWDVRKNYGMGCVLALGWLIFTPLTIGMIMAGWKIIRERPSGLICSAPILLLFGAGVTGITNTFLLVLRSEGIAVYHDRIELLLSGVFGNRLKVWEVLPFEKITRISFGFYAPDPDEPETVPTLNLFVKGSWWDVRCRRILAYWMRGTDKEVLANLLNTVVSQLAPKIEVGPEE
jgi:hypothetical protein